MSMIEGIRDWLKGYDYLAGQRIGVDNIGSGVGSFAIMANGVPETAQEFFFARTRKQSYFLISNNAYGSEPFQNMENLKWYEDFGRWVYEQDLHRNYPELGEHMTCVGVAAPTTGELVESKEDGHAYYQLQLTVAYTESLF